MDHVNLLANHPPVPISRATRGRLKHYHSKHDTRVLFSLEGNMINGKASDVPGGGTSAISVELSAGAPHAAFRLQVVASNVLGPKRFTDNIPMEIQWRFWNMTSGGGGATWQLNPDQVWGLICFSLVCVFTLIDFTLNVFALVATACFLILPTPA